MLDHWRQICGQQIKGQGEKSQEPTKAETVVEQVNDPGSWGAGNLWGLQLVLALQAKQSVFTVFTIPRS